MDRQYATRKSVIITKYHENVTIINILVSIILLIYTFVQIGYFGAGMSIDPKFDISVSCIGLGINILSGIYIWYHTKDMFKIKPYDDRKK